MTERIGEYLLQIVAVKSYQVDDVLHAQEAWYTRLFGEIAIGFGHIIDAALSKYIEVQEEWNRLSSEA